MIEAALIIALTVVCLYLAHMTYAAKSAIMYLADAMDLMEDQILELKEKVDEPFQNGD